MKIYMYMYMYMYMCMYIYEYVYVFACSCRTDTVAADVVFQHSVGTPDIIPLQALLSRFP